MNYFDTKFLHIISVFIMFITITVTLYKPESKIQKVLSGIFTLFAALSGVLLLRRFGISHNGPFPAWVLVKIACWLIAAITTPIIVKRYSKYAHILIWPWILIICVATSMAIYKPL
jgi:hypothetical protein